MDTEVALLTTRVMGALGNEMTPDQLRRVATWLRGEADAEDLPRAAEFLRTTADSLDRFADDKA
jgi:hypothetical protein